MRLMDDGVRTNLAFRCTLIVYSLVYLFPSTISAAESTKARPISEWIDIIEQEANAWYANETPNFAALRLAAGWSMPGLSGKDSQRRQVAEELPILLEWLDNIGYEILNRILDERRLTPEEEPYRPILLGLYLRAALDYAKTDIPEGRALCLDLSRLSGGREACLTYREDVNRKGQERLYRGYLTGKLTRDDVEAIRLYRIAQGQRVVGESFLPMHLGLHPLADGRLLGRAGGGHGVNNVIAANHGKPFYDVRLSRLETVLQSERYSDKLETGYHLTLSLRPEGVLDFLRVLDGYEPYRNEQGATVMRLRPELLDPRPGQKPADSVRLSHRVGIKPILLYINDPIDGPVSEQFPAFETIYQAYRDQLDCWFVAVDIHDWYYSGMPDMLSRDTPGEFSNTHSFNEEERARKAKNRYLESPHATFPCLIGNNWQSVKNFYGTGGGANHWVIIDRNGIIAEYTGNQDGNLNHVETAIRRILANDGLMAPDSRAHIRWKSPEEAPNRTMPANRRVRLHAAEVVSVDATKRQLTVRGDGVGRDGLIEIRLTPFARVCRHEVPIELDDLQTGETVVVDFHADDYLDPRQAQVTELEAPTYGTWRRRYELGDQRMEITLLGRYGWLRRRWYVDRLNKAEAIPGRSVRVLDGSQVERPGSEPVVMWLSSRVTGVDADTHMITIRRTPIDPGGARGYAFYQELTRNGRHVALTETARVRLREVERWLGTKESTVTVLSDDAVDYCLNGEFGGGFTSIAVDDFVGVRYYPSHQPEDVLIPHTIRISKPMKTP